MKYVFEHARTKRAIASWSGSAEAFIAAYFFWCQGVTLQKSPEGLLRTILFQILEARPALTTFCGFDLAVGIFEWTKARLLQTFQSITSQKEIPLKLCLFIDGLDESMEDPIELVMLLREISSQQNIKCIISSRPWRVFCTALNSYPQIHLQELNAKDINRYVSGKLNKIHSPIPLTWAQNWQLSNAIGGRAEGVFIWVSLATASVLAGIRNGDNFDELQSRVGELPSELNELYNTILSSVELRYRIQAMRYFQLLLLDSPYRQLKPSILILSLVDLGMKHTPEKSKLGGEGQFEAVMKECNRTFLHLQQRCGMLLHLEFDQERYGESDETRNKLPEQLDSLQQGEQLCVQFLHRIIYDFFRKSPVTLEVSPIELCHPWNPSVARAEAFIRRASIMQPEVRTSTAVADFDDNVKHLASAIAAVREAEISSAIPQSELLAQLDFVGQQLFRSIGQQCGFNPDVHWCVLLSPHFDEHVGSGNFSSLLELCATSGLAYTVKSRIPELSQQECTNLLNCALNGLLYLRDGHFLRNGWFCYDGSLLDTASGHGHSRFDNFKARASLIISLLGAGADPNAKMRGALRGLKSEENLPRLHNIQEQTVFGQTAWAHFLRMLTSGFYISKFEREQWQSLDTLPLWTEMTAKFLESGANSAEMVQNVSLTLGFDVVELMLVDLSILRFEFKLAASALSIIKAYFHDHECGYSIIKKIQSEGYPEEIKFTRFSLVADGSFRGVFDMTFNIQDPTFLENGCSWDISNGVIDHLGQRILNIHRPIWIEKETDSYPSLLSPWGQSELSVTDILLNPLRNRLPILNALKTMLILLNSLEPQVQADYSIQRRLFKKKDKI